MQRRDFGFPDNSEGFSLSVQWLWGTEEREDGGEKEVNLDKKDTTEGC